MRARSILCLGVLVFTSCSQNSQNAQQSTTQSTSSTQSTSAKTEGWLSWRGPGQMGNSAETGLIDSWALDGENHLWTVDLPGRGTPVVAGDRIYAWGYNTKNGEQQETLLCLNVADGSVIWERRFNDFISDIIYNRYSIGSPTVDADTGNIYLMTSPGQFVALNPDGELLWEHSMMEEFGRLTFPNGRTGSPVVEGDLVIVRGITTFWGKQGPARDRFYAFDKRTGEAVWNSTPGVRPTDSSFATPIFADLDDKRVFYCGTGCGNIVCVDARTGEPVSRFQLLHGGINSSVLLYKDTVIAIHGKENLDTTEIGRMIAVRMGGIPEAGAKRPVVVAAESEVWRAPLGIFTSSPVLAGNRVYQTTHTGDLACVDADSGKVLWKEKLSNSQLHASPLYADGKLYVPMKDGTFFILRPSDTGAEILSKVQVEGTCLGAPAVWDGRIYLHTTEKLYCIGQAGNPGGKPITFFPTPPQAGAPASLRPIPGELLMGPNVTAEMRVQVLDANGIVIDNNHSSDVSWEKFIPPTAKVKIKLNATPKSGNIIAADAINEPSAGMFKVSSGELTGFTRGRILPALPFSEDFESFDVKVPHKQESGVTFAYPPLPWIGARFKWEIRERDGSKVLSKTLDRLLFQRAMTFIGHPHANNYTMTADLMTDGNRRIMSTVGVVNQRYIVALKGNWQVLEVSSNHDRLKVSVPFKWKPNIWYTLKTRVDIAADGSGVVRAKAWPRDSVEPDTWTIEVPHVTAHTRGAPGLFGFSPQSQKRVYVDNISVKSN